MNSFSSYYTIKLCKTEIFESKFTHHGIVHSNKKNVWPLLTHYWPARQTNENTQTKNMLNATKFLYLQKIEKNINLLRHTRKFAIENQHSLILYFTKQSIQIIFIFPYYAQFDDILMMIFVVVVFASGFHSTIIYIWLNSRFPFLSVFFLVFVCWCVSVGRFFLELLSVTHTNWTWIRYYYFVFFCGVEIAIEMMMVVVMMSLCLVSSRLPFPNGWIDRCVLLVLTLRKVSDRNDRARRGYREREKVSVWRKQMSIASWNGHCVCVCGAYVCVYAAKR